MRNPAANNINPVAPPFQHQSEWPSGELCSLSQPPQKLFLPPDGDCNLENLLPLQRGWARYGQNLIHLQAYIVNVLGHSVSLCIRGAYKDNHPKNPKSTETFCPRGLWDQCFLQLRRSHRSSLSS
ncbi:hypothetical protein KC368_g73 [Hortaea werneckii]|nr:hypothetical protein KC368_g73 [Hortaea werneckii]